ncbi:MAG TPA: ABC transporter ATP-binding protein [Bacteroidia bacterium]|nr:ABC transporter ATP-binding protein [Bacteroidia bacterium]
MNQTNNTLKLQNVSIGHTGNVLIENISLQIQAPCLIGLIGNNGCGKTTLLKTISGLQKRITGNISFKEQEISALSNKEVSKIITFGFAFNSSTFPISVYELVSMGRYPYINNMATLSEADHKIVVAAIDALGIFYLKDKLITAISEGERQKAYIAKALAQQTPVLLLDEPTAFLDYTSKKQFFKTIKENVAAQNVITIVSSHDIDFLSRNADYLIMIQDDKKVEFEKTEAIMTTNYFSTHFNY